MRVLVGRNMHGNVLPVILFILCWVNISHVKGGRLKVLNYTVIVKKKKIINLKIRVKIFMNLISV